MANTTISDTNLAAALQSATEFRDRVNFLAKQALWADPSVDPQKPIPLDDICWAIVSEPKVRAAVRNVMTDEGDGANIYRHIRAVEDSVLNPLVLRAMTRLNLISS